MTKADDATNLMTAIAAAPLLAATATTGPKMTTGVAHSRIDRDLKHAEAALDQALLCQAQLLSTMVHARRETGVAPFMGQDAMMRLVRSQQAMLNAGGELARVHGRLGDIAIEMVAGVDRCPTPAFGMAEQLADDQAATDDPAVHTCAA